MFEVGFAVEVDPEFPADGGEAPRRIPDDLTRIGAVLRLTPVDGEPWDVAIGAPNWWRAPNPSAIAFISDWRGYVVDVVTHEVLVEIPGVTRIRPDQRDGLLLLATNTSLTAVGIDGIAWQTDDIARGDIKVVRIDKRGIVCSGVVDDVLPAQFVIDPLTGLLT